MGTHLHSEPFPPAPLRSRARPLLVMKFGGTSVATIEHIRKVARRVLVSQKEGNDVVLVVSAMGGETNRLLGLARQVVPRPDARELDVLAATGEQVSVALIAMAIQAVGGAARSLLGHQLRLLTDGDFTRARIQRVELDPVLESLSRGQIPVVAGFQGVDPHANITTLGRGGSDTTAVALAAALGADDCEVYTDVEGVYTADPRVCPLSRKLSFIPYEEMLELSSLGAKVLQVRSVEVAMKYGVPVHVRSTLSDNPGTRIVDRRQALEARVLTGLACERGQARVELSSVEGGPELHLELMGLLAELNLSADMICGVNVSGAKSRTDITFTVQEEGLTHARERLELLGARRKASSVRVSGNLAKVSLVGIGLRSDPRIVAQLCSSLSEWGIHVSALSVDELRISCMVDEEAADLAVRVLHDAFDLSAGR